MANLLSLVGSNVCIHFRMSAIPGGGGGGVTLAVAEAKSEIEKNN